MGGRRLRRPRHDGLDAEVFVEEGHQLLRGVWVDGVPDGGVEKLLAGGHLFLEVESKTRPDCFIHADTSDHHVEDDAPEALLEGLGILESHLRNGGLLDLPDLAGAYAVFAVVHPQLILPHRAIPRLPVVLPEAIVVAIHRRLEVKGFPQSRVHHVVGKHCVLGVVRDEVPVAIQVLRVE